MAPLKEAQRRQELRRHWLARPEHKRTSNDLLLFHRWLEENHPYLLTEGPGEMERLKIDLGALWPDPR